jgi:hypothetical protein
MLLYALCLRLWTQDNVIGLQKTKTFNVFYLEIRILQHYTNPTYVKMSQLVTLLKTVGRR